MGGAAPADRAGGGGLTGVRVSSVLRRAALGGLGAIVAAALAAQPVRAAEPEAVKCEELQTAVETATAGEVLQLPAEVCEVNLTIANIGSVHARRRERRHDDPEAEESRRTDHRQRSKRQVHAFAADVHRGDESAVAVVLDNSKEPGAPAVTLSADAFVDDVSEDNGGAVSIDQDEV